MTVTRGATNGNCRGSSYARRERRAWVLGGLYGTVRRDRKERRTNLRPACDPCNSETGGALATRTK